MILLCYSCGGVGDALRRAVSGILHNSFILSLGHRMTIFLLSLLVNYCALNTSVHPLLQSLTADKSIMCVGMDIMCTSHALTGKSGKYSKTGFLDSIVFPFGHST